MADIGARGGKEAFGLCIALIQVWRAIGQRVVVRGKILDLLNIEDGVGLEDGITGSSSSPCSLSSVLLERHPDRRGIGVLHC